MKKYLTLCILLIASLLILPAKADIKVSPTIIELDANNARGNYLTTSFDVQGDKDETIRFKIYPGDFNINRRGGMEIIEDSSGVTNSLINNIRFVPSEFTLASGQKQRVRVTLSDINKLPDGESRVVLFLEDVVAKEVAIPNAKGASSRLIVKSRVGIPIYLDKGKYTRVGQFDDLKVEDSENNLVYKVNLSSLGNSKIRYSGKGQIIKNKNLVEEFEVPSNPVSAKGVFEDRFRLPIGELKESGEYTLRLILEYQNEKNQTKQLVKETLFRAENLPEKNSASGSEM